MAHWTIGGEREIGRPVGPEAMADFESDGEILAVWREGEMEAAVRQVGDAPGHFAAGDIEQIEAPIGAFPFAGPSRRGDHGTVGRDGDAVKRALPRRADRYPQRADQPAVAKRPQPQGLVVRGGGENVCARMDGDAADFGGVHAGFDAQHRRLGKSGRCVGARTAHSMEQSDSEREKRRIDCRTPGCDHDYTIVNPNLL
ncbi:MAG: hypothetical protein VCD31_02015 [Alphaproteobacteria bacterium]